MTFSQMVLLGEMPQQCAQKAWDLWAFQAANPQKFNQWCLSWDRVGKKFKDVYGREVIVPGLQFEYVSTFEVSE